MARNRRGRGTENLLTIDQRFTTKQPGGDSRRNSKTGSRFPIVRQQLAQDMEITTQLAHEATVTTKLRPQQDPRSAGAGC